MRKSFKYRLFPTKSQRTAMQKSLDACRWVYNKTLEVRRDRYKEMGESLSLYDTNKMLPGWKKENPTLGHAYSQCLQQAQARVDLAFKAFFRRLKAGEEEPGFPRFKGFHRYDSFTYTQSGFKLLAHGRLRLSKVGEVKIKLHRPMTEKVKTLTVRRDRLGYWYACFSCIVKPKPLPSSYRVVGVDLGLSSFAHLSDDTRIRRERWMKRDAQDIARLQRKREQFPKESDDPNVVAKRRKVIRALNHAYQRQTNRRRNFAHQESRRLVNSYQLIVCEDLKIKEMQTATNLPVAWRKVINRGIVDVAWGRFVQFTTFKAAEAGRMVILVDPRNTTQQCSGCGRMVPKELHIRVHDCPHCGLKINRDLNAARNILSRGLATVEGVAFVEAHSR